MAKKKAPTDLISAFTWAFNVIENEDVPPAEQLTLMHIIARANRAFWKPIQISASKLAAAMCKDKRSVSKALQALEDKALIVKMEGGYTLGIPDDELNPFSSTRPEPAGTAEGSAERNAAISAKPAGDDAGTRRAIGKAQGGAGDTPIGGFRYFNDSVS